jgi:hypothetical protein
MEAYGDASFFGATGLYSVAVFLAPANDWVRLETQWRRILRGADPTLDVFHMTDFMSPHARVFRLWTHADKEHLVSLPLSVISNYVTYGCAAVMTKDGYETMLQLHAQRTGTNLPSLGTNAYALCADACIALITERLSLIGPGKQVAYFFEAGDRGLPEFQRTVNVILSKSAQYPDENRILSVKTVSKTEAPALQTADLLAYEFTHCAPSALTDNLKTLVGRVPISVVYVDSELLRRGTEGYTPDVVNALAREHNLRPRQRRRHRNA